MVLPMIRRESILGLPFFTGTVQQAVDAALDGALVVAPSGPNLANELRRSAAYREAVQQAGVILTDSALMVAVHRCVTGQRVPRHSGLKFIEALLLRPELREPGAVFWVMPSDTEAASIDAWLRTQALPVDDGNRYVAPFYPAGPIEDEALAERIVTARPRVVVINLAGGKQEILGAWLARRLAPAPGMVCTGAAIAFLAGTQARIPVWADRAGLGWLFRCLAAPRKFVPRYWSALPLVPLVLEYRDRLPPLRGPAPSADS